MKRLGVIILVICVCNLGESRNIDELIDDETIDDSDYFDSIYYRIEEPTTPEEVEVFRSDGENEYPEIASTTEEDQTINYENVYETSSTVQSVEDHTVSPEVSLLIENLTQTIANVTSGLQKQLTELENNNKKLQEKVEILEQKIKSNNLIFLNVPEDKKETHKTTLKKVLFVLNENMKLNKKHSDIAMALRVDTEDSGKNRPISVKFTNFATKMEVLSAKSKLKNSPVVIESDYSEGVARTRAELVPYLIAAKAYGLRAYILYDRLVVNGRKWTLQKLIAESKPDKPTRPSSIFSKSFKKAYESSFRFG